jgi:hypothetical protein
VTETSDITDSTLDTKPYGVENPYGTDAIEMPTYETGWNLA